MPRNPRPSCPWRVSPFLSVLTGLALLGAVPLEPEAREQGGPHGITIAPGAVPAERLPGPSAAARGQVGDTLDFGSVDEDGFAVLGERWTWDHGGGDPSEGWQAKALSIQEEGAFARRITPEIWTDGDGGGPTGNPVAAPILDGNGSLWIGVFQNEADESCWEGGLGYGNFVCRRAVSPVIDYDGASAVDLSFRYFNDTELNFDYTRLILRRLPDGEETLLDPVLGFTDRIGTAPDHPASLPTGATYEGQISTSRLAGATAFQLVFQLESDAGWSDEDGSYDTAYGPFAADEIVITGGAAASFDFETGLEGWSSLPCAEVGPYLSVVDVGQYGEIDPCGCRLSGNVLAFHDEFRSHPVGQHDRYVSNPVDIQNDVRPLLPLETGRLDIIAEWDQYADLPEDQGVYYRAGWTYYPWTCPVTGGVGWSPRVGPGNFVLVPDPQCYLDRSSASTIVPSDAEQVRFIYEIASCSFGVPEECLPNNFSPLIDNVRIRFSQQPAAPPIAFENGKYQDGFPQTLWNDPHGLGNADVSYARGAGTRSRVVLGDSLAVRGPFPTLSSKWESRLWFRIAREGPGNRPAAYNTWKARVADGHDITGGEFTYAWMDSLSGPAFRFVSYFREDDDDYDPGSGEFGAGNEIIRDGIFVPGTSIEYFVTANYTATPDENFLLPDTAGGYWDEFEILPRYVLDAGIRKYPSLLYVDAAHDRSPTGTENALDRLGVPHDRYDYLQASSNWKPPLARGTSGSNNGASYAQLLGYRAIIVDTGALPTAMWSRDWLALSDWLSSYSCSGNLMSQGLILNGDHIGTILHQDAPAILATDLAAARIARSYRDWSERAEDCVAIDVPAVGPIAYPLETAEGPYAYAAFGNECTYAFDVLGARGQGIGNRTFVSNEPFTIAHFSQIAHDASQTASRFRSVIDGIAYHHLTEQPVGGGPPDCVVDPVSVQTAVDHELEAALVWMFGADPAAALPLWGEPCSGSPPTDVPGEAEVTLVTRLYPATPNPFQPRTLVRFSLAQAGEVELSIVDASGRRVRDLLHGFRSGGRHEAVWDGTSDRGHAVASGVYWSQLFVDGIPYTSKLVLLR